MREVFLDGLREANKRAGTPVSKKLGVYVPNGQKTLFQTSLAPDVIEQALVTYLTEHSLPFQSSDDEWTVDFTWGQPAKEIAAVEEEKLDDGALEDLLTGQMGSLNQVKMKLQITAKAEDIAAADEKNTLYYVTFSTDEGESFKLAAAFKEITTSVLSFAVDEFPAAQ